ncbi:MAG: sigma-70 family RNA polymerase sigma factor [Rhodospirillales bacterium]|nr:sigma-70 family RNA polymerase sigma factor [Rhodospirillales bacterium]
MAETSSDHPIVAQIPHLRRYARALLRDRTMAEDLVQDCLERAWGRLHLWQAGSNLRTWLFTIMHNLHANAARAASRRPRHSSLDDNALGVPVRASQEDRLEIATLESALAALPDEQRQVVLLVGLEGMSYQETAAVIGAPIGTVMSRLHRGRERLRELLAGMSVAGAGGPGLRRVK